MPLKAEDLRVVLATDCGSTTTKAILFEKKPEGWRQTFRGEAPTTVEAPFEDVTIGARNAITEVEELSGRKILEPGTARTRSNSSRPPARRTALTCTSRLPPRAAACR